MMNRTPPTQDQSGLSYLERGFQTLVIMHKFPCPRREYPVGPYRIDFAYPFIYLGIELDGQQHYTKQGRRHDSKRDAFIIACGWKLLRANRESFYREEFIESIRYEIKTRTEYFIKRQQRRSHHAE